MIARIGKGEADNVAEGGVDCNETASRFFWRSEDGICDGTSGEKVDNIGSDDVEDEDEDCWVSEEQDLSNCTLSTLLEKSYLRQFKQISYWIQERT